MSAKIRSKKAETKNLISLTLMDRLILPTIFKKSDTDFRSLIIIDDLKTKIKISQKELTDYSLVVTPKTADSESSISWDIVKTPKKFDYDFTELEKNEVKLALESLDADKKANDQLLNLYRNFVLNHQ